MLLLKQPPYIRELYTDCMHPWDPKTSSTIFKVIWWSRGEIEIKIHFIQQLQLILIFPEGEKIQWLYWSLSHRNLEYLSWPRSSHSFIGGKLDRRQDACKGCDYPILHTCTNFHSAFLSSGYVAKTGCSPCSAEGWRQRLNWWPQTWATILCKLLSGNSHTGPPREQETQG